MAVDCSPQALAEGARCFCFDHNHAESVKIYLLAVIAGLDGLTQAQLAERAKCYCFDAKTTKEVQNYLLCQIANGGSGNGDCANLEGAGDPT